MVDSKETYSADWTDESRVDGMVYSMAASKACLKAEWKVETTGGYLAYSSDGH